MANVKKYTDQIAKAQKGRDVRDAIVNAINAVSDENNEYNQVKTDILEAQTDITEKVAKNEHTEQKFVADVKKAETLKQGLDSNIEQGTALKSQLETTISTADTGKKNLDASNTTAAETKADLDASNATASETKTGLDATNKTAAGLVTSLGDKIAEGTQVKTDIQTTGETAMSNLQAEAAKQQEYIKTSIDDTLSVSGKAADAAVTGKKIDSLKEDISTKITKFYASSQGETHLADSDNGKIQDMMVYGRSEQKQYSGKNLLNPKTGTTTKNGITCTANDDGTFTLNGTATASFVFIIINNDDLKKAFGTNEELRLTGAPKGASKTGYYLQIWKNEPEVIYRDTGGGVTAKKPNASCNVAIVIVNGTVFNNVLFKPMLTTDLTATYDDFEPYTGGIPSPNPDYPQEIKSVANPTVKVCGKNLFKATLGNVTANGITCTANSDGTYILNGTCTVSTALSKIGIFDHILNEPLYLTGVPSGCGSYLALGRRDGDNILVTDGKNTKIDAGIHTDHIEFWITKGTTLNNVIFKPMLTTDPTVTYDDFEPYHEQTVTLPYTLNAIPVESGGNVTIDGQQYIADYVDVERGKLVRMVYVLDASANADMFRNYWEGETDGKQYLIRTDFASPPFSIEENAQTWCNKYNLLSNNFEYTRFDGCLGKKSCVYIGNPKSIQIYLSLYNQKLSTIKEQREWLKNNQTYIYVPLNTPEEADLTTEEIAAFKALATYYPITNISINSEQLDGYAVFNYPISMENGWNYVKQQIGDTREYIYDMDARAQDTDLQAAEAYVNSEYAVALTELEV